MESPCHWEKKVEPKQIHHGAVLDNGATLEGGAVFLPLLQENSSTFESGTKIVPRVELTYVSWNGSTKNVYNSWGVYGKILTVGAGSTKYSSKSGGGFGKNAKFLTISTPHPPPSDSKWKVPKLQNTWDYTQFPFITLAIEITHHNSTLLSQLAVNNRFLYSCILSI